MILGITSWCFEFADDIPVMGRGDGVSYSLIVIFL